MEDEHVDTIYKLQQKVDDVKNSGSRSPRQFADTISAYIDYAFSLPVARGEKGEHALESNHKRFLQFSSSIDHGWGDVWRVLSLGPLNHSLIYF